MKACRFSELKRSVTAVAGMLLLFAVPVLAQLPSQAPGQGLAEPALEDIRGAKPLVPIPPPPPPTPWLLYGGIALAVLLGLALAIWLWKRRPAPLSAEAKARTDLERLAREGEGLRAPEFALAASSIVRLFIERRFGLAAPKRTTEEFLRELSAKPDQALHPRLEALRGFLKACDRAKFAAAGELVGEERAEMLARAREFVATPVSAPTAVSAPAPAVKPAASDS